MNVPLLDLKAQYATIRDKVRTAVDGVFESQRFVLGPNVETMEAETARLCGVPHAIGLASGTDALLLSLKAVGAGPGDAVVTVPFTFFATAGAIVNLGARPVFVDIEPAGFSMDPVRLAELLENDCTFDRPARKLVHRQSGTVIKAIVPVHLYGQCAEMDEILAIARRYELPVIEDACQALGAKHVDRYAGSMGDLGCFSFFPSKNLGGAGDGGMVVSGNEDLARKIRLLRGHGMEPKYYHSIVGFNSRLDEIQAAVLRVKLGYLDEWNQGRRRNAALYEAAFLGAGLRGTVKLPAVLAGNQHIFHQYVICCPKRDELRAFLQNHGIGTDIYYPLPLHRQECFRGLGYGAASFPRSNEAAAQCLALPIYAELTPEQINHVVRRIAEFYA
ncbi:MAG: DegT/DnrJ/EryC1/StrS family aminotransferase [Acidobacteriota bacterium]|jgi:dTDP-4-amino-4,6-dideoxygalactose transaminase